MRGILEIGLSAVLVVWIGWVVYQGSSYWLTQVMSWDLPRGWGRQAGLFPALVGAPVLVLAILQLLNSLRSRTVVVEADPAAAELTHAEDAAMRSLAIIATMVGFAVAILLLGFVIAIPGCAFLYLRVVARESWRISVGLAAIAGVIFYGFFVLAIGVRLPDGLLIETLFG